MKSEMSDLLREMCFREEIISHVLKIAENEEDAVNMALEIQENPSLMKEQPTQPIPKPKIPKKKNKKAELKPINKESSNKESEDVTNKEDQKEEEEPIIKKEDMMRMVSLIR